MGRYHIHPVLSVTVDRDDDVYVADWNTNFIHVYQEERRYIEKWRIVNFVGCSGGDFGQLRRPMGVAVDKQSNIYVKSLHDSGLDDVRAALDAMPAETFLGA